MTTTQKVILAVAVGSLVVALFFYFRGNKGTESLNAKKVRFEDESVAKPPPRQPLQQDNSGAVLVMFFSPGCGHCTNMMPAWDQLMQSHNGQAGVQIIKVNGAENHELTSAHGVRGFPTIKYCRKGLENPSATIEYEGNRSYEDLVQFLQQCTQ